MLDTNEFGALLGRLGFCDFSGVPCSYLAPLINYAINSKHFIMANNEGDAVAIAAGISLASMGNIGEVLYEDSKNLQNLGAQSKNSKICDEKLRDSANEAHLDVRRSEAEAMRGDLSRKDRIFKNFGCVLMQNSGLSNALSPLTSLNHTFKIPIIGFVSLRGERNERGENTDEPQHELLGVITDRLLETCQIEYEFLDSNINVAKAQLERAREVLDSHQCFFFIVREGTFAKVGLKDFSVCDEKLPDSANEAFLNANEILNALKNPSETKTACGNSRISLPTRLQALEILQNLALKNSALLLATTGKTGRELYEIDDTPNQLYMVGSMGCVSSLALGLSLKATNKVLAIDGDSALLMRLGVLSTNAYYAKAHNTGNFCHILLDNQSHDSTGGQFNLSPFVDFCQIARSCGYELVINARDLGEFRDAIERILERKSGGASFVYLRIAKGSKENLGRPKVTPRQVAQRLAEFVANPKIQRRQNEK